MRSRRPRCALSALLSMAALCFSVRIAQAQTVAQVAAGLTACQSRDVAGLSDQVFALLMCTHPGALVPVEGHNVVATTGTYAPTRMYLRPDARDRLYMLASYGRISVNDTFRTVVDQHLFHIATAGCLGNPTEAGQGRHETGTAIDVNNGGTIATRPASICCRPLPSNDPVHFECRPGCAVGGAPSNGDDLQVRRWGVVAFQHLWNVNHPTDRISEDGIFGAQSIARLNASPARGFPIGGCEPDRDGDGSPASRDCNDTNAAIHPGATEVCNNTDDNCNAMIDEGITRACGSVEGECSRGTETCAAGGWSACIGAVGAVDERCDGRDNDCDGETDEAQVCEREEALLEPGSEGGFTDVDGDGRADACARTNEGFRCLLATGRGFAGAFSGPTLAEGAGLSSMQLSASLRMGDLDGDGRADVCALSADGVQCWRLGLRGNGETLLTLPLGAGVTNLLLADVDADRRDDVCVRDADGLRCYVATEAGSRQQLRLDALSDAQGFGDVTRYGTLRMGDLDGDGRADVCARSSDGMRCWLARVGGFGSVMQGPAWRDADGYGAMPRWSTIRLADVDSDGRSELCARTVADEFICHSLGARGFEGTMRGPRLPSSEGWDSVSQYATLRLADVNGDGALDLCGRASDGVRCWLWTGESFGRQLVGPALSDAEGWGSGDAFRSLRMADVTGDGRADLCVRDTTGLRCYESSGVGFSRLWLTNEWADRDGFGDLARAASVRIAGVSHASRAMPPGCACVIAGRRAGARSAASLAVMALAAALAARRRRT